MRSRGSNIFYNFKRIFSKEKKLLSIKALKEIRKKLNFQLQATEIYEIIKSLKKPVNLLIFGIGNDSIFWHRYNKHGKTIFLEDDIEWRENIINKYPEIKSFIIDHDSDISQWKELIDEPKRLYLKLPKEVKDTMWDVIIIDGPKGFKGYPGRMKSIFMSSRLIKKNGDIFVHDSGRIVEKKYSDKFLRKENLVNKVYGRSILSHYKMKNINRKNNFKIILSIIH